MTLNVTYPEKRTGGGGFFGSNGATTAHYNYAQANELTVGVGLDGMAVYNYTNGNTSALDAWRNSCIVPLETRGIQWYAEIESMFWYYSGASRLDVPWPDLGWDSQPAAWDAIFGPFLDYLHDHCNTKFCGFHMEGGCWNMWTYLKGKMAGWAPVCAKSGGYGYRPDQVQSDGHKELDAYDAGGTLVHHTMPELVALVDEFEYEFYTSYMFQHGALPLMLDTIGTTPSKKGVNMDQVGHTLSGSYNLNWWIPLGVTINGSRPYAEQLGALQKFNYLNELFGKFDWFCYNYLTGESPDMSVWFDWGIDVGVTDDFGLTQFLTVE